MIFLFPRWDMLIPWRVYILHGFRDGCESIPCKDVNHIKNRIVPSVPIIFGQGSFLLPKMAQLLSETRMIRYKKKHTHISPNKKSQSGLSIEKKNTTNKQQKKNKVLTNPKCFSQKKNSPVIEQIPSI